jgi:hypothetical protein
VSAPENSGTTVEALFIATRGRRINVRAAPARVIVNAS